MRSIYALIALFTFIGCASNTRTIIKERNPDTGELVTVREEATSENNAPDPFNQNAQKAANADLTKACAVRLEKAQEQDGATQFRCSENGELQMFRSNMWIPFGGFGAFPGGVSQNGLFMNSPYTTGFTPGVVPNLPTVQSRWTTSYTPPLGQGQAHGLMALTESEMKELEVLRLRKAECETDPRKTADERCQEAVNAYEHFWLKMARIRELKEKEAGKLTGQVSGVQGTDSGQRVAGKALESRRGNGATVALNADGPAREFGTPAKAR